jgi:two-component system cell cycle response regulator
MKRYLEKLNLVITHYANAEEALSDFIANDYDLVITDVMLEGNIDGVSLVRMIRAQNTIQSQTPILALTSFDDPHRRIELFRAGVNDYVTKPPVEEELAARVNNLITNKRLLDHVRQQKHTLHEMAMKDQLTGCNNRHSLVEYAPKVLQDADRYNYPLSIMILDLDHFKLINDKHGHTVGDDVLADVGKQLRACCRQGDFVCRLGGEEFIMILPHCNSSSAITKAEELRARIENSSPGGIYVTASIGIASLSQRHKHDFDRLYKDADEAVYLSKKNGRNKVSQFEMAVS